MSFPKLQFLCSQLHSSTQNLRCRYGGDSVATLVMMASAAEFKLLVGPSSMPKENDPRPERSCQGQAGSGAWEERGTVATLCCASACSSAGCDMKHFTRLQCLRIPSYP